MHVLQQGYKGGLVGAGSHNSKKRLSGADASRVY